MAQDDIYRINLHYEGPTQPSSISLYYQEDALSTGSPDAVSSLNFSFFFSVATFFRNVLSDDWWLASSRCRRLTGEKIAPDLQSFEEFSGTRSGRALPANNCLLMQLLQANFPRTSNGRLYLPGLTESDTDVGVIDSDFLANEVTLLGNRLSEPLAENAGSGSWSPVVISAKVRDAGPGPPDWESSASPMIAALGNPVIARQTRRTTKIIGRGRQDPGPG